jgi:Ca-activated chloride channel family protein
MVFGKWRGRPEGRIVLRGTSGNRPYAQSMDVSQAKPLEKHRALSYLWARHRVAMLCDYNRLEPRDEREKEVTNLGLSYNLLTAYTSFVAVDTQVRLVDGHPVLVKQPLPLPQGVSNLAVGHQRSVRQTLALTASGRGVKGLPEDKCCEYKRPGTKTATREPLKKTALVLDRVAVTGDLSAPEIRKVLQKAMADFNRCYPSSRHGRLNGKVVFVLQLDSQGRVTQVLLKKNPHGLVDLIRCLKRTLQALHFPASPARKTNEAVVIFAITG